MIVFEEFKKVCTSLFDFLITEFHCVMSEAGEAVHAYHLVYQNMTTVVRVSYEPREGGAFVLISRLVDGKAPQYPVFITPDTIINSFYLDDLVKASAANNDDDLPVSGNLYSVEALEPVMSQYAHLLRKYGKTVLCGNFQIFRHLDRIVKDRAVRKHGI